jgi:Post-segregation antitoxin CcdA
MRISCASEGVVMKHAGRGLKKAVNMTLSKDLVREARGLTPDLPKTAEHAKRTDFERRIDEAIDMINAHYEEFGLFGEDSSTV